MKKTEAKMLISALPLATAIVFSAVPSVLATGDGYTGPGELG